LVFPLWRITIVAVTKATATSRIEGISSGTVGVVEAVGSGVVGVFVGLRVGDSVGIDVGV